VVVVPAVDAFSFLLCTSSFSFFHFPIFFTWFIICQRQPEEGWRGKERAASRGHSNNATPQLYKISGLFPRFRRNKFRPKKYLAATNQKQKKYEIIMVKNFMN